MIDRLRSKLLLSILILFVGIVFVYWPFFYGFFQQDEWLSFGFRILLERQSFLDRVQNILAPNVGHYQPLTTFVIQSLFGAFKLNFLGYALTSIFLHLISTLLVFLLAKILFKDNYLSFLSAAFFGLNASGVQATTWVLADVGVHLATISALVSLSFLFLHLKSERISQFIFSIAFLVISLLFKEITIALFLILPLSLYIFEKQKNQAFKKKIFIIIICGFLYSLARVVMIFLPQAYSTDTLVTRTQTAKGFIYNLVTFPFKAIAQTLVPFQFLKSLAYQVAHLLPDAITGMKNTTPFDNFVQKRVLELLSMALASVFLVVSFLIFKKNKSDKITKILWFGLSFTILNSFIYVLAPERVGIIPLIDSRNLYFLLIGTTISLIALLVKIFGKNYAKILISFSVITVLNLYYLSSDIASIASDGVIRKSILTQVKTGYPTIPSSTIFYTESDTSFYGLPEFERILPFQSGFGQTLLIWYSDNEHFPDDFYSNKFLWEISSQGYRQAKGRGFGYFRKFPELVRAVVDNNLDPSNIIAFYYDSKLLELVDNSQEIRGRLAGFLAKKSLLLPGSFHISSTQNNDQIFRLTDQSRETFWDSKLPYGQYQFIDIDLLEPLSVSQINIDSFKNKNQNKVGYKVFVSSDKENWEEVFYSQTYPPDDNGIVEIYFKPTPARFLRLAQVGRHLNATWIINELQIFENE